MSERKSSGFTVVELLICCAIIGLIAAIALPIWQNSITKARRVALAADFTELYSAFMRYHVDYGQFPPDVGTGALNVSTLAPLATSGYFNAAHTLTHKLQNDRLLFYWAPDWEGPNSDFIVIARSELDPDILVYTMHYDFGGFAGYDGVYLLVNGVFVRADGRT